MATYIATLESLCPLLMHRWTEQNEHEEKNRKVYTPDLNPRDEATKFAYRLKDGRLFMPAASFSRLLREAGSAHKQRGSRKSLKYIIPVCVIVLNDVVELLGFDDKPLSNFEVDSRPVVIPATKGRIMRHRPKILEWRARVSLEIDETMIDANFIQEVLSDAGRKIGIGDFRPEKGGAFGRFMMINWAAEVPLAIAAE